MTDLEPEAFQAEVLDRISAFANDLPSALREPFVEMLMRRGYLFVDEPPDYFNPLATPLLALPIWIATRLRRDGAVVDDDAIVDAAEAALTGYFLIRVHDDFSDEDIGDPHVVLFLSTVLQTRMQVLFARIAPVGSPFWPLYEELFTGYGDAMLLERRLHRTDGVRDAETFESILRRSDLLLLAGAAVLAHADRWELLPPLRRMTRHLVRAVQLFNDVFDAEEDQARGTLTYVVCRYGGDEDAGEMRAALLARGGLDEIVDEAIASAEQGAAEASAIGLTEAEAWFGARAEAMAATRKQFFASLLKRLLSAGRREDAGSPDPDGSVEP